MMLLESVMGELIDRYGEEGIQVGCSTVWFCAKEECDRIGENFRDGRHANEMETSVGLALFPEDVKMKEAQRVSENYQMRCIIFRDFGVQAANRWPDPDVYHGAYGNPVLGSAEKGEAYLEALINDIARTLLEFAKGRFNPCGSDGTPRSF
jgi:creatinine amidohydrolase